VIIPYMHTVQRDQVHYISIPLAFLRLSMKSTLVCCFLWHYWGLNSGALSLEPLHQLFFELGIFETGPSNYLPGLA
jgi:hypothetical protein